MADDSETSPSFTEYPLGETQVRDELAHRARQLQGWSRTVYAGGLVVVGVAVALSVCGALFLTLSDHDWEPRWPD